MRKAGDCLIYHTEIEVTNALSELGLAGEELSDAVHAGEVARRGCSRNDAAAAPGWFSWSRTIRALREIKLPQGWTKGNDYNLETVRSPDREIAIAVSSGDSGTGHLDLTPKTKYPKGSAYQKAVEDNRQLNLAIFSRDGEELGDQAESTAIRTWLLLRHIEGNLLRWEISLPLYFDSENRVSKWAMRIVLPPVDLSGPSPSIEEDESDTEIDISIERHG